jgi:hypothetical protein
VVGVGESVDGMRDHDHGQTPLSDEAAGAEDLGEDVFVGYWVESTEGVV